MSTTSSSSCPFSSLSSSTSKTYTDGYTKNKRTAHVITALALFAVGMVLIGGAVVITTSRPQRLFMLSVGVGGAIALISILAMIPILRQPVVEGRPITVNQ